MTTEELVSLQVEHQVAAVLKDHQERQNKRYTLLVASVAVIVAVVSGFVGWFVSSSTSWYAEKLSSIQERIELQSKSAAEGVVRQVLDDDRTKQKLQSAEDAVINARVAAESAQRQANEAASAATKARQRADDADGLVASITKNAAIYSASSTIQTFTDQLASNPAFRKGVAQALTPALSGREIGYQRIADSAFKERTLHVNFKSDLGDTPQVFLAVSGFREGIGGPGQPGLLVELVGKPNKEGFTFRVSTNGPPAMDLYEVNVSWIAFASPGS